VGLFEGVLESRAEGLLMKNIIGESRDGSVTVRRTGTPAELKIKIPGDKVSIKANGRG